MVVARAISGENAESIFVIMLGTGRVSTMESDC